MDTLPNPTVQPQVVVQPVAPLPIQVSTQPSPPKTTASETQKMNKLVASENEVLFEMTSVFPFRFFPVRVSIEKNKVNFSETVFFGSQSIRAILVADISKVNVDSSFFFATLRVYGKIPSQAPFTANYLWRSQAFKARRILDGLMMANSQDIDSSKIPAADLVVKAEQLGSAK